MSAQTKSAARRVPWFMRYSWHCCGKSLARIAWFGHFNKGTPGPDLELHEFEGIVDKETGELISEDPFWKPETSLEDETLGTDAGPTMVYGRVKPVWYDHHPITYFLWFMMMSKKSRDQRLPFGDWMTQNVLRYLFDLPNPEPMNLFDLMSEEDAVMLMAFISEKEPQDVAEILKDAFGGGDGSTARDKGTVRAR